MDIHEQWKLNGDCAMCRREEYCTKQCGAKKRRVKHLKKSISNAIIDSVLPEPFSSHAKMWTDI